MVVACGCIYHWLCIALADKKEIITFNTGILGKSSMLV